MGERSPLQTCTNTFASSVYHYKGNGWVARTIYGLVKVKKSDNMYV